MSSIALGFVVQDEMIKAASIQILLARTICSGKYLIVIGGSVSDVEAAIAVGRQRSGDALIDYLVLPNVHSAVFPALGQSVTLSEMPDAIGLIETFGATAALAATDAAAKAARVVVPRVHLAMAVGGKGLCIVAGSSADVRAAVEAGIEPVKERGLLVSMAVINRPSRELLSEYL